MSDDELHKIGEITMSPPQDVDCSFCGEKASIAMAAVISPKSSAVICASCIGVFHYHLEEIFDALIESATGATIH